MNEECIIWSGLLTDKGYGQFWLNGKSRRAHRTAWEIVNGPIPEGLIVCHKCDNPPCFNVNHLFIGTYADNSRDMHTKGRGKYGTSKPKPPKRDTHTAAKLSRADVAEIRIYLAMGESQRKIAKLYGMSSSGISKLARGVSWAAEKP